MQNLNKNLMQQNVNDNDNQKLYNKPLINFKLLTTLHGDINCITLQKHIDTSPVNNVQVTKDVLIHLQSIMC